MATINFDKKYLEKYIKVDEEMTSKATMMGAPAQIEGDQVIIEVTPNRPDLLSLQGFLRAYRSFTNKESGIKKYKIKESGFKLILDKSLPKEWPYAVSCIVKGLKFDDDKIKEVIQIQEKLGSTLLRNRKKGGIGIYPLDKIKFPITFKGMEPDKIKFRPLEYPEEITGRQILSKHPTGREYAHICQNWNKFPVFIDSNGKTMSMPPIINSHDMGKIDESTKDVFIEATGNDLKTLKSALNIISTAFAEMGGQIYSMICVQQNGKKELIPDLTPSAYKVKLENVNRILGLNITDIEKLVLRAGYDYKKGEVFVPPWRVDVIHEVDIIEDIAISYGYDKLIPEINNTGSVGEESKESKIEGKISEILCGLGLIESSSYHLIKEDESKKFGFKDNEKIEVENSKTDYKLLRPNLIIPIFRILSGNKDNEYPQNIFEIGTVFEKLNNHKEEIPILENKYLTIACSPSNFTKVKQILDYLMKMIKLDFDLSENKVSYLIEGRTGIISMADKKIGEIGEVNPQTLREFGIKMPVALININLSEIFSKIN